MAAVLPYLIAEFAKLAGLTSIASLGTAKAIDTIRNYVKANPEKSEQIISTLSPTVGGLANIVLNKKETLSPEQEELFKKAAKSKDPEPVETDPSEKPRLTGKEKGQRIKDAIRRASGKKGTPPKGNYSSADAEGPAVDIRGSVIREVEDMGMASKKRKPVNPNPGEDKTKYGGPSLTEEFRQLSKDKGSTAEFRELARLAKKIREGSGKAEGGIISLANGGMTRQDLQSNAPKGEFLAYINPKEAGILKSLGGSGKPVNGIPSFDDEDSYGGGYSQSEATAAGVDTSQDSSYGGDDQEDDNAAMAAAMAAANAAAANAAAEEREREIMGLQQNRRNNYGLNRVGFETPYGITDPDLGKAVVDYSTPFGNFNGFLSTLGILGVDNPMTPGVDESQQSKGGINFTSPNMFGIEGLNTKADYTAGGSNPGANLGINFSKKFKNGGLATMFIIKK